jgi:hypothetical protein
MVIASIESAFSPAALLPWLLPPLVLDIEGLSTGIYDGSPFRMLRISV